MPTPPTHLTTTLLLFAAVTLLPASLSAAAPSPSPAPSSHVPSTRVEWRRAGTGAVEVTGSRKGTRLVEATTMLQRVADRLDCLRTSKRHVRWSRLIWTDGRIQGLAVADSAIYGNVALLAMRDLLPGRATAGSGVQQIRTRDASGVFKVRILVGAPRNTKPIRLSP